MLPASNKGPSQSFGAPDVCLTPVGPVIVPIPYPNFAAHAMACVFSTVVTANMLPALNLASIIALTTGDEPGVAHWTVKGIGTFVVGNPVVFIEGLPGIMLTALTMGNKMNCPTGTVVAPGAPNVLYTLAPEETKSAGEAGEAGEWGESDEERLSGPALEGEPALLPGGIGLVRARVFSLALPGALHLAIERLVAEGMSTLVLDLRGCPGGELLSFVEAASDFLPAGARIATLRDAEGDESPKLARGGPWSALPVFLVVDRGTASAAELFAGALAGHGRATIVGERTYGKAVARTGAGGARSAGGPGNDRTIAEVLSPDGSSLGGAGLSPHIGCAAAKAVEIAIHLARGEGRLG